MKRTLTIPLLLAGSVGMTCFVGCGTKGDDTGGGDGGAATAEICNDNVDNDGDGLVDCDDSDCAGDASCTTGDGGTTVSYFEPDFMLFAASGGLKEGAQFDVSFSGKAAGSDFSVLLINSADWTGPDDTRHFCQIYFDTMGADVDSSCTDCWAGAAWTVDTTAVLGTAGECDNMDPAVWGDDVTAYFQAYSYSYGFGPNTSVFRSDLQTNYKKYWADYSNYFLSNYVKSDLTGDAWTELNYAFAYEFDPTTGELIDDGSGYLVNIDVTSATFAPDGWYNSGFFYGYGL